MTPWLAAATLSSGVIGPEVFAGEQDAHLDDEHVLDAAEQIGAAIERMLN